MLHEFKQVSENTKSRLKKAENPTGFMIAVEKLAPPEADASLETCTAV